MHHGLRHRKDRLRTQVVEKEGTLYLNAARCPRIVEQDGKRLRNISMVTLLDGQIQQVRLVWVDGAGSIFDSEELHNPTALTSATTVSGSTVG